jgi:hypothetical protein
MTGSTTRRDVLRIGSVAGLGLLLAACGGQAPAGGEKVNTNPTGGGEILWSIIGD